jgi:hypothetical protein
LVRRLRQFIVLRWVAAGGITATALIAQGVFQVRFPIEPVIGVSIAVALYNILFLAWDRRINRASRPVLGARLGRIKGRQSSPDETEGLIRQARRFAHAQISADLVALAVLLHTRKINPAAGSVSRCRRAYPKGQQRRLPCPAHLFG